MQINVAKEMFMVIIGNFTVLVGFMTKMSITYDVVTKRFIILRGMRKMTGNAMGTGGGLLPFFSK